jgi:hypothetical protein
MIGATAITAAADPLYALFPLAVGVAAASVGYTRRSWFGDLARGLKPHATFEASAAR